MKKKLLIPLFLAGMALPFAMPKDEITLAKGYFVGEYSNRNAYINYGKEINGRMADEGFVLLKNDGTLPLEKGAKISVFGKASTHLARGGAGSGSGRDNVDSNKGENINNGLRTAGFEVNSALETFYNTNSKSGIGRTNGNSGWSGVSQVQIGETPISQYDDTLKATFEEFGDCAIQVVAREGSEGCDVKTCDARDFIENSRLPNNQKNESFCPAGAVTEKHALQLSDNEQALLEMIEENFDHVIFVINSSNIFEIDSLLKDPKIAAILWIGNPGDVGAHAVGRILCGDVNPSGHTVDTWARDFRQDPTWKNFSDNAQNNPYYDGDGNLKGFHAADTMFTKDGEPMMSFGTDKSYKNHASPNWADQEHKVVKGGINGVKPAAYVSYEEGIYIDYRYYETRYADMAKENKAAADAWYDGTDEAKGGVARPFGFGLSYTTFKQEIVRISPKNKATLTKDNDVIEISVKVTNTGNVAGKDAVQVYWKAPYTAGGIEKADRVLCAFDKTNLLEPGKSEVRHLKFHLQDVANYDFSDANQNGFKGYELDAGNYQVTVNKNAHEEYGSVSFKIAEGIKYETDRFTGYKVENHFTDNGFYSSMPGENDIEFTQMSRKDFVGTFPTTPNENDRRVKEGSRYEEFLTHEFSIGEVDVDGNRDYVPAQAVKTEADAEGWENSNSDKSKANRIQLKDMKGLDWDDPKWEEFVNEASYKEMMSYVEGNKMSNPGLSNIGKEGASEGDGPQEFNIMWWVSSPIVAATYSPELAHLEGECVGCESQISGKSGWWGPAVNTHRSPFGGRNFEYYSADPFLMGRMAAIVVGTATDRGVYAYFKHFAVNDQEKNRESGISFVNEQALREIYLRSFQMVFEEGKSTGVMGSYNRCGLMVTAANWYLLTEVLRNEWGFKGAVLSDMTHSGNSSVNFKCYECVAVRNIAGCSLQLDSGGFNNQTSNDQKMSWDATEGKPMFTYNGTKYPSYTWWYAIRRTYKENMYMFANCTAQAKGVTQAVVDEVIDVQAGKNFERNVADDMIDEYNGKAIESADYELNYRVELPEGVTFADGKLSGSVKNLGIYRVDVIAKVTFADGTEGVLALKYAINVTPNMSQSGLSGGANMAPVIIGASVGAVVVCLAVAGVVVFLTLKKKKAAAPKAE